MKKMSDAYLKKFALEAYAIALGQFSNYNPRVDSSTDYMTVKGHHLDNFKFELPLPGKEPKLILSFLGNRRFDAIIKREKLPAEEIQSFIALFKYEPTILCVKFPLSFHELSYLPKAIKMAISTPKEGPARLSLEERGEK